MIRISLSYFHDLGATFGRLRTLQQGTSVNEAWGDLYAAERAVLTLLSNSVFASSLRTSRASANALYQQLQALTGLDFTQADRALTFAEIGNVTYALNTFETILKAELAAADAYFVTPKRGYDTLSLISEGEVIWPPDLYQKVPSALDDVREAGKCIAFELGTAAGFHILRAVESVLLCYWKEVTNNKPVPANKNIGNYLNQLEKLGVGDSKIISVLRQIKDLHRNELFHPDASLTVQGAIELLGIAQSAVGAMLKALPEPKRDAVVPPADPALSSAEPTPDANDISPAS